MNSNGENIRLVSKYQIKIQYTFSISFIYITRNLSKDIRDKQEYTYTTHFTAITSGHKGTTLFVSVRSMPKRGCPESFADRLESLSCLNESHNYLQLVQLLHSEKKVTNAAVSSA